MIDPALRRHLQRRLLRWYARRRRHLPWRQTRDPYAILVSEVMLHQTPVERVLGYYELFLKRYPTVQALAAAHPAEVREAWEGLGYYDRARNLQRAAQMVIREHRGRFPKDLAALQELPGVGRYTAGAVSCLAFHRDAPMLDTNAARVLGRAFGLPWGRGAGTRAMRRLWALAEEIIPSGKGHLLNQGLMDLGATICRTGRPRCPLCPLHEICRARASGSVRPLIEGAVAIIRADGRLLVARRPRGVHLGGMWEFPGGGMEDGESPEGCLRREVREELGMRVRLEGKWGILAHRYPERHVVLHCFFCAPRGPLPRSSPRLRWVQPEQLFRLEFPPADRPLVRALSGSRYRRPRRGSAR